MAASIRLSQRRRFAWLLWFGLLFAVAQGAANAHAVSHLGQDAGRARDALVHAQCDLCLIGATIAGAAPLPELAPALPLVRADVPRETVRPSTPSSRPDRPYQSRAPPVAPH